MEESGKRRRGRPAQPDLQKTQLVLTKTQLKQLDEMAHFCNDSRSRLVRQAIQEFLNRQQAELSRLKGGQG